MFVYIVKVLSPLECYEPWCANKCSFHFSVPADIFVPLMYPCKMPLVHISF